MQDKITKAYSVLGLNPGSSHVQIRDAWKRLSKEWHPDTQIPGTAKHKECVEKQKVINQAYDLLKDLPEEKLGKALPQKVEAQTPADGPDALYEAARSLERGGDVLGAMKVYKKLGESGHSRSQFRLGYIYFDSIMKDLNIAFSWWKRAAEQGHVSAQYNLALMYEQGTGVPVDQQEAVHWYSEAAKQGDAKARARLNNLAKQNREEYEAILTSIQDTAPPVVEKQVNTLLTEGSMKPKASSNEESGRSFLRKNADKSG